METTLFLCGDVMTGRGIDQILPAPADPSIHEPYLKSARDYVRLAECATGPIPFPADGPYIWGDALDEFARVAPDLKIVNLETSVTVSGDYLDKGINYRMSPENIGCLTAAGIDCCTLANNHVFDWGRAGLVETIEVLGKAGIKTAGAGLNLEEARRPAVLPIADGRRVFVHAYGDCSSGIPRSWAAHRKRPGVNLLRDFSEETVRAIREQVACVKVKGDISVFSIHWGSNWGYEIPEAHATFAHRLIDTAGIDIVHGHSSHHFKAIEVYRSKLILYGCGDFLNDYEGISGYEGYRDDLGLMYFVSWNAEHERLAGLTMVPTQIRHFRVNRSSGADALWTESVLNREGSKFGTSVIPGDHAALILRW